MKLSRKLSPSYPQSYPQATLSPHAAWDHLSPLSTAPTTTTLKIFNILLVIENLTHARRIQKQKTFSFRNLGVDFTQVRVLYFSCGQASDVHTDLESIRAPAPYP